MNVLSLNYTKSYETSDYMVFKNDLYENLIHPFFNAFLNVTYLRADTVSSGGTKYVYSVDGFDNLYLCVCVRDSSYGIELQICSAEQTTSNSCIGSRQGFSGISRSYSNGKYIFTIEGSICWCGDADTLRGFMTKYSATLTNMYVFAIGGSGSYVIQNTNVFEDATSGTGRTIFSLPTYAEFEKLLFSKAIVVNSSTFIDILLDVYRFENSAFSSASSYLLIDIGGTRYRQVAPYLFIEEQEVI